MIRKSDHLKLKVCSISQDLYQIEGKKLRKIGYIRAGFESQKLKRQLHQLNEIGMDINYQEKVAGATVDRKELQNMLEEHKEGDTIFVTNLTSITRSTKDLFSLIEQIPNKNACLKSLKDTCLELSEENPYSQFLITIMDGVID